MLQQMSESMQTYAGGNNLAAGMLIEDSFEQVDGELRMSLKKLYKKDATTKVKALEELKSLLDLKSQSDCIAILPIWSKCYAKLTIVNTHVLNHILITQIESTVSLKGQRSQNKRDVPIDARETMHQSQQTSRTIS
jgi:hypothetical protein